ncbi:MAG: hypothetical protein ABIO70_02870 [Pseudomonadota bacterium]
MTRPLLRTAAGVALTAWALIIGALFVALEPSGTLAALPWGEAAAAACATLVALLACTGGGAALLARTQPAALDDELGWLRALAVGLVAWGLLSLPAALLLGVHTWVGALTIALLAAGWLTRPPVRGPRLTHPEAAWGLLIATPALLCLLTPATETDEIYYHLALPARLLMEGHLLGGPWMPNGSRPLALHLPWTWLLGLGGFAAPRAFALALGLALLLAVRRRAQAWWGPIAGLAAPLLLAGSASFLTELGLAHVDLAVALLTFVALDAGLAGRLPLLAMAAGGALAAKYNAALALAPLFAVLAWRALRQGPPGRRARALGGVALTGLAALAVVAPWWLRNVLEGLHPLFPFTGWAEAGDMAFQFRDRYGAGHGLLDLLLLPWRLIMAAEDNGDVFLGRLQPALLALAPAALWAAWREPRARLVLAVTILGGLLWWSQVQWLRYLLPVLPIAALAAAAGMARLPRWAAAAVGLAFLLGLPANLRPVLRQTTTQAPAALGLTDREAYLEEHLGGWEAVRWLNEHSPEDAQIALLFCWPAWPLERPWVLGSVEEHVPSRHLLAREGDASLRVLREGGVTWVLRGRVHFLHKTYPFLDGATFEREFVAPEEHLDRLLAAEGVLMFEQGRYQIWKLPER